MHLEAVDLSDLSGVSPCGLVNEWFPHAYRGQE